MRAVPLLLVLLALAASPARASTPHEYSYGLGTTNLVLDAGASVNAQDQSRGLGTLGVFFVAKDAPSTAATSVCVTVADAIAPGPVWQIVTGHGGVGHLGNGEQCYQDGQPITMAWVNMEQATVFANARTGNVTTYQATFGTISISYS